MPSNAPFISVLMVSYNSSKFISEAINSVLRQTYQNFELVIVDDRSNDNTWEIINSFQDPRIRKFQNESNLSEYRNRNKAIEIARGDYSIFIDADDYIYEHGLAFMVDFAIQFPAAGMVVARPWDEKIIYPFLLTPRQLYAFEYLDFGAIGINFTKVLFKTSAIKTISFPSRVKLGDIYMQYEVALTNTSLLIPDASTWWRRTSGQASEKLLKDYRLYLMHELWIKLDKLNDQRCPLSSEETKQAYINIYGNFLRYLLKLSLRLKWNSVYKLLDAYPVPKKYLSSILSPQKRDYFQSFSGVHPLKM
jgi:glycosyltransferase involved in cell wall biosynthesis